MTTEKQKTAQIKNELQVPLIVRDFLEGREEFTVESHYAMSETLSNLPPCGALLSCAFAYQNFIAACDTKTTNLDILNMACDRLIERYVSREILADENPDLWEETQPDMMICIAEDIEETLILVALCEDRFKHMSAQEQSLLNSLRIQLQAQFVIVEEVLHLHELLQIENIEVGYVPQHIMSDNVIAFPA